jgi:hypothetical protein
MLLSGCNVLVNRAKNGDSGCSGKRTVIGAQSFGDMTRMYDYDQEQFQPVNDQLPLVQCRTCWATVVEDHAEDHVAWHERTEAGDEEERL